MTGKDAKRSPRERIDVRKGGEYKGSRIFSWLSFIYLLPSINTL